jgi:hypothetical protein
VVLELLDQHLRTIIQNVLNALKVDISLTLAVQPALIVSPVNTKTKKVNIHVQIALKDNFREIQVKKSAKTSQTIKWSMKKELRKL